MVCYAPYRAWYSRKKNPSGKRSLVFRQKDGFLDTEMQVGCSRCIGCRVQHTRDWAVRAVHEASAYVDNCFITLTYNNDNLPLLDDGTPTLDLSHLQKFMKRLRKRFGAGIRYFACGEYGDKFQRPHYHLCLFNFNFDDRVAKDANRQGQPWYVSQALSELWPFGYHVIGMLNFQTVAYTARYVMKKFKGKPADKLKYYAGRREEFVVMSRRPGLGFAWIQQYVGDVYPHDYVVTQTKVGGKLKKLKPPRYYDNQYDKLTGKLGVLKNKRKLKAIANKEVSSRLEGKHEYAKSRLSLLVRGYEQ